MRFITVLAGSTALVAALYGCGGSDAADPGFNVAVIGDSPYGIAYGDKAQFNANPAFISAINADPSLSMVMHTGDIHSGKEFCTESYNKSIYDQWKAFKIPVIYAPGDNEWADCHKAKEGGGTYNAATTQIDYVPTDGGSYAHGDPLANLSLIRSIFFSSPGKTLGASMSVHSQALEYDATHPADAQFPENVWFEKNGVMFVSLNVPGGSNNDTDPWYGTPAMSNAQQVEVSTRTDANLRWLDTAFATAKANKDIAMVIQLQADMWDQDGVSKAHLSQYKQFIDKIATKTTDFAKPVLMINGDSHNFRSDNPLKAGATCVVEAPATATVGAALVPAASAVPCNDASVASVAATYHKDAAGATTDPYSNQPYGYDVSNFHRIVAHTNPANPLEYLKLTINPNANAANGSYAFGPFSWSRVKP